jgi:hypothetical protein
MAMRSRYLPLFELEEGMVIGKPLDIVEQEIVTFSLPQGHVLTQQNLEQLAAHNAAYACIEQEDERTEEEKRLLVQQQSARLAAIFKTADFDQPATRAFHEALQVYRGA